MARTWPTVEINKFIGMDLSKDPLHLIPGQLRKNENYLYLHNGGLEERGGGDQLTAAPSSGNPVLGLGNYQNSAGSEYLITAHGTDLYYYDSGWNSMTSALTTGKKIRFESSGAGANIALYGVNGTDSVVKVSGATPTYSAVASSPTDCITLKLHKNRLFGLALDGTLYFTDTNAFDTWNVGSNTIEIAPGLDGQAHALAVWGDALFIFKENGIYVLPNADEATSAWVVLRTDAITGTTSTDSVRNTRDGIYFLASDNYVRKIGPTTTFSSGEYTLDGSGSPIVSHAIYPELKDKLDNSNKDDAFAITHDDLYILYWQSTDNSGSYNDRCFFADTAKFHGIDNVPDLQPYWGEITGAVFQFAVQQFSSNANVFYGTSGNDGIFQECFNSGISNDAGNAIASKAYIGWLPIAGPGVYKAVKSARLIAEVENWTITFRMDGYNLRGGLPADGAGASFTFDPNAGTSAAVVGTAVVGTDQTATIGIAAENFRMSQKGHYVAFEVENTNIDEFTRIHSVLLEYKPIRSM
jgi:hypothetical protein